MASSFRIDISTLRPLRRLEDGRLIADGYLTRTGVFEYRDPDGTVRQEYRPPDEVFNKESMDSFALVPVTDDHPPEMIDAENATKFSVGQVGETIRRDLDNVAGNIVINDAKVIAKMEAGKTQLSCGYQAEVLMQPGTTPDGVKYDAIQTKIRGNHVAIVDVARAGPQNQVRMDASIMVLPKSADERSDEDNEMEELKKQLAIANARIKELEGDKADQDLEEEKANAKEAKDHADVADAATATAVAERDAAVVRADTAEGERDAAKVELEAAKAETKAITDGLTQQVQDRVDLLTICQGILGKDFTMKRADSKDEIPLNQFTENELRCAVILDRDKVAVPEGKLDSSEYIQARFDAAVLHAERVDSAFGVLARGVNAPTGRVDSEEAAQRKMVERHQNQWKTPAA